MNERPTLTVIEGGQSTGGGPDRILGIPAADLPAFRAWSRLHDGDPDEEKRFAAAYCGPYDSREAWALEVVISMEIAPKINAAVPEWFGKYLHINLGDLATDMELLGEVHIEPNPAGGVWVFDVRAKA